MDKLTMHKAVKCGDLKALEQLIKAGVSVDSRDNKGRTPLHVAAECGQYNVVQLLISSKASLIERFLRNPGRFVSSKCDINAVDLYRYTPVMLAAENSLKDVVDLLLRHGAQVSGAAWNRYSLVHYASRNGWADTAQHILNEGEEIDIDAMTIYGETPLMLAVFENSGCCAEILLRAGADPNRKDAKDKRTALHLAVYYGHTRVIRVLLRAEGLDLNLQDVDGWTPLHLVCKKECREILKEMLEAGADYTIRDNNWETALSLGIKLKKLTLEDVRLFVQRGLFFEEKEYMYILQNSILKESVLKDVSLCTQSVVNKFHRQSLRALKSISYYAKQLPNIDNFKLNDREIDEVEELVKCEIGRSNFCNVIKIHPMSLKALCILTLITF